MKKMALYNLHFSSYKAKPFTMEFVIPLLFNSFLEIKKGAFPACKTKTDGECCMMEVDYPLILVTILFTVRLADFVPGLYSPFSYKPST